MPTRVESGLTTPLSCEDRQCLDLVVMTDATSQHTVLQLHLENRMVPGPIPLHSVALWIKSSGCSISARGPSRVVHDWAISQCAETSAIGKICRPIGCGHICFETLTEYASTLRSVWSEPTVRAQR